MRRMELVRRAAHLRGVNQSRLDAQVRSQPESASTLAIERVVESIDVAPIKTCIVERAFHRLSLDLHRRNTGRDPQWILMNPGDRG